MSIRVTETGGLPGVSVVTYVFLPVDVEQPGISFSGVCGNFRGNQKGVFLTRLQARMRVDVGFDDGGLTLEEILQGDV